MKKLKSFNVQGRSSLWVVILFCIKISTQYHWVLVLNSLQEYNLFKKLKGLIISFFIQNNSRKLGNTNMN